MRLWLRFLGGALVFAALTAAAVYLLIELREYVEEEYFSGAVPLFFDLIYITVLMITLLVLKAFTIGRSGGELMEIAIEKKERKQREKERKKRESEIEEP